MTHHFTEITNPDDLQIVRDIAASIWPETFRSILSQEQITYMMNMMYAPEVMEKELAAGYIFELVVIDGVPGGYIVCSPCDEDPQHILKLHKAYLLQEYHSKGIGQLMLDIPQNFFGFQIPVAIDDRIRKALEILENIHIEQYSISALSKAVNLSETRFLHLFKSEKMHSSFFT